MKKAYLHNIKYALNNGYHVAIRCAEEGDILQKPTDSYNLAKEGVDSTGNAIIIWCKRNEDARWKAHANFVAMLGDEPENTIIDYSGNALAEQWANDYDKECYPA